MNHVFTPTNRRQQCWIKSKKLFARLRIYCSLDLLRRVICINLLDIIPMILVKERSDIRKWKTPIPPDRKRGFQMKQRSNKRDFKRLPKNA